MPTEKMVVWTPGGVGGGRKEMQASLCDLLSRPACWTLQGCFFLSSLTSLNITPCCIVSSYPLDYLWTQLLLRHISVAVARLQADVADQSRCIVHLHRA